MTPSQHLLELNLDLQHRITQLQQDNQQLQTELTQLRQEHERLQQSQARYQQLFENAPISMLFINTEGYITEMNRAAEHQFGLSLAQLNQQACPIFANAQLVENGTLPYMLRALAGETVIEAPTYYDSSQNFDGGKFQYSKGHYCPIWDKAEVVREIVEISPDFSDLWAVQQTWQQERDRAAAERLELLGTIAQVANLLLKSPDYTTVLFDVVRLLGEAVGSDRCAVTQDTVYPISGQLAVKVVAWWDKPGIVTTHDLIPEYETGFILEAGSLEFHQPFLRGEVANFLIADLPEPMRSVFAAQGNTSMLIVPIMVQGQCWGEIGFDNCEQPRLYDEAEIAILKIAADSIAAAIERREKDDELRRSEALYRSLFEISNEGIYRWQLNQPVSVELPVDEQVELVYRYHSFAQANDALAKMYGLAKAEDIVGVRLAEVHQQDSEITLEMMRVICGNGWQIRNAESEEIDALGQRRYYLNSIISFVENGFVSSGWGTQIDITQLREAQQALLEAQQTRAELLKTMTTIANHLLRSTDYRLILPDVLQLLGEAARADRCSLAQNITDPASGKSAVRINTEWCRPGIQASIAHTPALESALLWEDFAELYERLIQGETVQFFGTDLCASLRELFEEQGNTAMLMVPIVVQGEFWGVFGFNYCGEVRRFEELDQSIFAIAVDSIAAAIERQQQDEALRESEKRYRTLFEMSNEGTYRFEFEQPISILLSTSEQIEQVYRNYRIAEVNPTFVVQYGLSNRDELIGSGLIDTHVPDSQVNYKHARIIIENGYSGHHVETEEIDSEGQRKYFLQNVVCDVRDGYLWGGWGTQTDITELKQAQQALLQAEQAILLEREQAAQARAAELAKANEVLKRTVSQLVGQDNLAHFLSCVLLEAAQEIGAVSNAIFLYDRQSNTLQMHSAVQNGQVVNLETDARFEIWKTPVQANLTKAWEQIAELRGYVWWNDLQNPVGEIWPFSLPWHRMMGHESVLCVPLLVGREATGFMGMCFREKTRPLTERIELTQALAHQASLAIQLTRLAEEAKQAAIVREQEQAAQTRAAELAKANDVLKNTLDTLATEPELDCFLRHILSVIAQQMDALACLLWLFDDSLQMATLHLSYTNGQINLTAQPRFHADPSYPLRLQSPNWIFRTDQRQPYLVEVATPQFTRASCAYLTRLGIKAILIVPLWLGDRLIGSFGVRLPVVRNLAPSELELVQALAHQATLALQLMQLTEQASHSAVLEERNRMAREIHDVLAQAFTGVVVHLEAAKMITLQDAPIQPLLAQAEDLARAGLVEARRSVWSLRPQALENTNLQSALAQLVQALTHNTSVQIQLQIQGVDCAIAPDVETHLLRIAQEALSNALTHAQASTIAIELTFGTQVVQLCVRDDGQGFSPTAVRGNGFGLVSMQERAECINGEFTLSSQPDCGTAVRITAPLSAQSNAPMRRS